MFPTNVLGRGGCTRERRSTVNVRRAFSSFFLRAFDGSWALSTVIPSIAVTISLLEMNPEGERRCRNLLLQVCLSKAIFSGLKVNRLVLTPEDIAASMAAHCSEVMLGSKNGVASSSDCVLTRVLQREGHEEIWFRRLISFSATLVVVMAIPVALGADLALQHSASARRTTPAPVPSRAKCRNDMTRMILFGKTFAWNRTTGRCWDGGIKHGRGR